VSHPVRIVRAMDLWCPPRNVPHLYEWWRPLVQAGARARSERLPWSVHLDEFRLVGRVGRDDERDVWIYEHVASGGSLCVDLAGEAYRFVAPPGDATRGQFVPAKLGTALRRAGVPRAITAARYVEARPRAAAVPESPRDVAPTRAVRRGHLSLV
jgi:hypothetical protein